MVTVSRSKGKEKSIQRRRSRSYDDRRTNEGSACNAHTASVGWKEAWEVGGGLSQIRSDSQGCKGGFRGRRIP